MPKRRKQILLEDTQYERLVEMARSIDRTVTDLVGELVERGLEDDAARRRKFQALDRLAELGERIEKRGGVSATELVGVSPATQGR
jgi:predicted DNA-binding ribbon-helix-helix protein